MAAASCPVCNRYRAPVALADARDSVAVEDVLRAGGLLARLASTRHGRPSRQASRGLWRRAATEPRGRQSRGACCEEAGGRQLRWTARTARTRTGGQGTHHLVSVRVAQQATLGSALPSLTATSRGAPLPTAAPGAATRCSTCACCAITLLMDTTLRLAIAYACCRRSALLCGVLVPVRSAFRSQVPYDEGSLPEAAPDLLHAGRSHL